MQQLEKVLELETHKGEELKDELEQESDRVQELNKKLEESRKMQDQADCQAKVVELEQGWRESGTQRPGAWPVSRRSSPGLWPPWTPTTAR